MAKKRAAPARKKGARTGARTGSPAGEGRLAPQRYETVAVERLRVHPRNPRRGDVPAISRSVRENGFYGAVVAQKSTGFVLAGNHRYMAAVAEGLSELPVIWLDVDDDRAKKIMLADNRASDLAAYDDAVLAAVLKEIGPENLAGSLWEEDDLTRMIAKETPPEAFPEFDDQVKVTYCCPKCGFKWS